MKHERFGFYCERKDDPSGRVDTLRLDLTDRTYQYIALIDRSQLGKGYYGDSLEEVPVTAEQLAELHRIVRACFEGGIMTTGGRLLRLFLLRRRSPARARQLLSGGRPRI